MKNEINEAHEAEETDSDSLSDESVSKKRKVVVPGEVIVSGEDFLHNVRFEIE